MGNSGSVHHMQSGLKELHTYYQVQSNDTDGGGVGVTAGLDDFSFLKDEQKMLLTSNNRLRELTSPTTTTNNSHSHHFKVLPSLSENLRLRSTTNGAILHSGGTISGRRESLIPTQSPSLMSSIPPLMERSRTFIAENSEDCSMNRNQLSSRNMMGAMQRRSQTQLEMDIRKRNSTNKMIGGENNNNINYKRFSSNLDLRRPSTTTTMTNDEVETYSNETNQKLSKVKIKIKKRKAPPVPPPLSSSAAGGILPPIIMDPTHSNDLERKQRLFKTKTETTTANNNNSRQQPIKRSQQQLQQRGDEEFPGVVMRRSNLKAAAEPPPTAAVFRREKSFDAKLLSSGNGTRNSKLLQQEFKSSVVDVATKRKSLQISKTTTTTTTPIAVVNKIDKSNDFKMELEVATKYHFRSSVKKTLEPSARQRNPSGEDPRRKLVSPPSRANKQETQSKIPQLKKTFYFGMESSKRKPLTTTTTRIMTNKTSSRNISTNQTQSLDDTTTNSLSKEDHHNEEEVYLLNHQICDNDKTTTHDNGIQLNVRPTLPRRQLEIPRFSPVAAWRTLPVAIDEHRKEQNPQHSPLTATSSTSPSPPSAAAIETANTFLIEDRIHRTYRDPCPFYPDNKSGDSGISGDDGYIVEKPIQPHVQNNFYHEMANFDSNYQVEEQQQHHQGDSAPVPTPSAMKVVGPFLAAWTPQQDLEDEEDSSSDGGGGEMAINIADSHTPTSPHVFSLSLPRENQLAVYGEKNKLDFRSLQKLKRTTSNDLNINGVCNQSSSDSQHNLLLFGENGGGGDDFFGMSGSNFRSDNWVLSKTNGMAAASRNSSTHLNIDSKNCADSSNNNNANGIDGSSSYFDLSISVQPMMMSLGSLATGKHVMYLPNRTTTATNEFKRQSSGAAVSAAAGTRPTSANLLTKYENSLEELFSKNIPIRSKRFSFQSSVRQIERRRLAEKLSREADQKEALRKSELEAMRRVEEEFQKKRAYEKASIRQQLRLYSMDDDNFMSLPNINDYYRAEPDGAVSSASEISPPPPPAPVLGTPTTTRRKKL